MSSADTVWLCRPGLASNPCALSLDTTVVSADGTTTVERATPAAEAPIDCFYVYPTISAQGTLNADLSVDPELVTIAEQQAARFSSVCRVFAPVYRQVTVSGLINPTVTAANFDLAYADVRRAWIEYLARDNRGRGVVHYCVANMPGAVPRTSTRALGNATLPFVLALADKGWRQALIDDKHLLAGLNVHAGHITFEAVARVVRIYALRFRIEGVFFASKTGLCETERAQFETFEALARWITLKLSVAVRAKALLEASRHEPDVPADRDFAREEIDGALLLHQRECGGKTAVGTTPTLGQMVTLIAQLGGYTGKSSGGPPGIVTFSRGMEKVQVATMVLSALRSNTPSPTRCDGSD